jgi:hypothetical protein
MRPSWILACALLTAPAAAQSFTETFDSGSNTGDWEVWWSNYNTIESTGGNPDWYLRLDNTSGSATCHFLRIFMNTWPSAYSGNYRTLGVTSIGLDVNVVQGAYGGVWTMTLGDDAGTPLDDSDDCLLVYTGAQPPPGAPGWTSYDFPIDAQSTTLPNGWTIEGPCASQGNAAWDAAIQSVDYVAFRLDTNPAVFCSFTNWDFGVDNIRIEANDDVGTSYCNPAVANSTGSPGAISGTGSLVAADNDLLLTASDLPDGQFAYFIASQTQGFVANPAGSQGNLCVVGSIARFNAEVGAVVNGEYSTEIDLTDVPLPPAFGYVVMPGDSWSFQCWYRDQNPGATSNFTNGLQILFQ